MTPDPWRLEITADHFTKPPKIERAASIESPLTMEGSTALGFPAITARELLF